MALLPFLVSGCTAKYIPEPPECSGKVTAVLSKINLTDLVGKLSREFCTARGGPTSQGITDNDIVVIPDYLDVSSFNTGQAGVILGEVTRGAVSEYCQYKVRQIDLGKSIRLNSDGVIALTRDSTKVANPDFAVKWGYIGTFAELPGKLLITLRELDMESGATTRVVSREVVHGCRLSFGRYAFSYSINRSLDSVGNLD
jgi:hypothetical protein